mgnify:CR=1 FL=1
MMDRIIHRPIISIHALREESDFRTKRGGHDLLISIHALREESDRLSASMP